MSNHLPEVTQLAHSRSRALGQAISPKALLFTLELPCLSESAYVRGWHEKERETTVVSSQTVHLILGKGWGFSGGDGKRRKWGGGRGRCVAQASSPSTTYTHDTSHGSLTEGGSTS